MTDADARHRPRLWVVCPEFGVASQTWLWRQIVGFRRFDVSVATARLERLEGYPLGDIPFRVRPELSSRMKGGRWLVDRVANLRSRNFMGLRGADRAVVQADLEAALPDVALAHFGQAAVRVLPLTRRLGVPLVAHFHGLDLSSSLRNNRWYRWSLKAALPGFAAVVVVGTQQAKVVEALGVPRDHIHLIPCGVPIAQFEARPAPQVDEPLRFISISRLVEQKGVDISLAAFARVAASRPEVRFDVVGDGPQRASLEAAVDRLGVGDMVTFHGDVAPDGVRELLRGAQVFVQHSIERNGWFEGFGVSVTEASATALPVVVSRCGGMLDQVIDGETGLLVEQGDVAGMAAAMEQLADEPQLRVRLGRAGRERAVAHFDTATQVHRLEDVLEQACGRVVT